MKADMDYTNALRGHSSLLRLEFSVDVNSGTCTLVLDLAKDVLSGTAIRAEFQTVSNFSVRELGGGYTQLLALCVEYVGDRQLDRVNYEVKELERGAISFFCQRVSLSSLEPG